MTNQCPNRPAVYGRPSSRKAWTSRNSSKRFYFHINRMRFPSPIMSVALFPACLPGGGRVRATCMTA